MKRRTKKVSKYQSKQTARKRRSTNKRSRKRRSTNKRSYQYGGATLGQEAYLYYLNKIVYGTCGGLDLAENFPSLLNKIRRIHAGEFDEVDIQQAGRSVKEQTLLAAMKAMSKNKEKWEFVVGPGAGTFDEYMGGVFVKIMESAPGTASRVKEKKRRGPEEEDEYLQSKMERPGRMSSPRRRLTALRAAEAAAAEADYGGASGLDLLADVVSVHHQPAPMAPPPIAAPMERQSHPE